MTGKKFPVRDQEVTRPDIELPPDIPELTPLQSLADGSPVPIIRGGLDAPSMSLNGSGSDQSLSGREASGNMTKHESSDYLTDYSRKTRLPIVDLKSVLQDPDVRLVISEGEVRRRQALPLLRDGNRVIFVVAPPIDISLQAELDFMLGSFSSELYLTNSEDLQAAIEQYYGLDLKREAREAGEALVRPEVVESTPNAPTEDLSPVVRFVDWLLLAALKARASDIHIEAQKTFAQVRFRIDGELRILPIRERLTLDTHRHIISRIKIMSELDIAIRDRPQDGRLSCCLDGHGIEFRVSITPTQFGEKVVLRRSSSLETDKLSIDDLGLSDTDKARFLHEIHRSLGLVLVTGPTGSGKTTTLAAALSELNKPEVNIMTAEDPIEVTIPGVNQQAINEARQVTFASSLRSFLRQDPDIIMIGEIRDFETVEMAVKAAMTGHMVLSTLHTNSAIETVNRLFDMGVDKFNLLSPLLMVCAQRLVRRICPKCVKASSLTSLEELIAAGFTEEVARSLHLLEPTGRGENGQSCPHCNGLGFRGRVAIYEIMVMNTELRTAFNDGFSVDEVLPIARRAGLKTLREAALEKVVEGVTTLSEALHATS